MKLFLYSVSHHDCPLQVREKLTLTDQQQRFCLQKMHDCKQINEALVLNTCNRLEFIIYAGKTFDCAQFLNDLVAEVQPKSIEFWRKYSRDAYDIEAIRHLFAVAAGLDSQMVGENQVLSQLKSAYNLSIDCRTSKFVLHRLLHAAFRVGKRVRTGTDINCGAVSVSLAAVQLAKTVVDLSAAAVMVIGAGENAALAARYLLKARPKSLHIANRSLQKARALCSTLGAANPITLRGVVEKLPETDLIISSTASQQPLLTHQQLEHVLADRDRPLVIIDIAVPRDIDPAVGQFQCVKLFNINDLNQQICRNQHKRREEIPKAQRIVDEFTDKFAVWMRSLELLPVISRLTQQTAKIAEAEVKRYARNFSQADIEQLNRFAQSLVNKVMHGPISFLKETSQEHLTAEQLRAVDLINRMFLSDGGGL